MNVDALGPPVDVRAVLEPERRALLALLEGLDDEQWAAPTPCPGWSVHDLCVHLLHDDLRRLSLQRGHHAGARIDAASFEELAAALDEGNQAWVSAVAPALSPRLTRELLAWSAEPTAAHLCALDPEAIGDTVSWAGPGPHPNWLDVAREFTERWVHQQQLREAVGRPGVAEWTFLEPVLDTFARALPACLPSRPPETEVQLRVSPPHQTTWAARSTSSGWALSAPRSRPADAEVEISAEAFWRRATRMVTHRQARSAAEVRGDPGLVAAVLDLRGAIVRDPR